MERGQDMAMQGKGRGGEGRIDGRSSGILLCTIMHCAEDEEERRWWRRRWRSGRARAAASTSFGERATCARCVAVSIFCHSTTWCVGRSLSLSLWSLACGLRLPCPPSLSLRRMCTSRINLAQDRPCVCVRATRLAVAGELIGRRGLATMAVVGRRQALVHFCSPLARPSTSSARPLHFWGLPHLDISPNLCRLSRRLSSCFLCLVSCFLFRWVPVSGPRGLVASWPRGLSALDVHDVHDAKYLQPSPAHPYCPPLPRSPCMNLCEMLRPPASACVGAADGTLPLSAGRRWMVSTQRLTGWQPVQRLRRAFLWPAHCAARSQLAWPSFWL